MSMLDDARKMQGRSPWFLGHDASRCFYCNEVLSASHPMRGHADDCPWLSMPKIVAALEAAHRVVTAWQSDAGETPIPGSYSGFYVDFKRGEEHAREKREAKAALVAAMQSTESTA